MRLDEQVKFAYSFVFVRITCSMTRLIPKRVVYRMF